MGSVLDLTTLLSDVERIYYTDRSEEARLQALDALLAIGNEQSMERLITTPAQGSARIQKMTQQGVARYFMDKYPALEEQVRRRGTFSLDDVESPPTTRAHDAPHGSIRVNHPLSSVHIS